MSPSEAPPSTRCLSPNAPTKGIPVFLLSLYEMVGDKSIDHLIYWSPDGDSFFVEQTDRFAQEVLGKYFKHQKYSSFVRQLNNYGFEKVPHLQQGALRPDSTNDFDHYKHTNFQFRRDRVDLLVHIQRKGRAASDDIQAPEVRNPSRPASMPEIVSADDTSEDQLLETILVNVGTLEHRQTELEAENRSLRDELRTTQHQLELMWRLLASLGLVPMAEHPWTTRKNDQLMIQGVPGKAEIGEATDLDMSMDRLSDHDTISSPSVVSQNTVSAILAQADFSEPNSPISIDTVHSPPPSSTSSSDWSLDQSTDCLKSPSGNDSTPLLDSNDSGLSNQADDFSTDLADSLIPSESLHLTISETDPCYFDSNFVDPPVESISDLNQNYGMGENDVDFSYHIPASFMGSSSGVVTGSDTQSTSGIPGVFHPPCNPTDTTVSVIRRKRKASVMMYESERTGPECAPHAASSSLSPYDTHSPADFICPMLLLPLNDQHLVPTNSLIPDHSLYFPGFENDSRSPKRAKCTLESGSKLEGDNF